MRLRGWTLTLAIGCGAPATRDGVAIELGAVATLDGERVGLGAVAEASYELADGSTRRGAVAYLSAGGPRPIGAGSIVSIGGARWRVVSVYDPWVRTRWTRPRVELERVGAAAK